MQRAAEEQSLLLHGMLRPSPAADAAAGHHECWSLNGQNRLGAHEWPGGGHLVVLLRRKHSTPQPSRPPPLKALAAAAAAAAAATPAAASGCLSGN